MCYTMSRSSRLDLITDIQGMKAATLIKLAFAVVPAAFSVSSLAACKGAVNLPSEQVHIAFEKNTRVPADAEAARLSEWVATMKSKYAVHEFVTFVGSSSRSETAPEALATARAVAVLKRALDEGLVDAPMQIKAEVYPSTDPGSTGSDSREVTVQLSPGCPNHCCADD